MPFKISRFNCCGFDVHKTWTYACIGIIGPNGRTDCEQAHFSSPSKGLKELYDQPVEYNRSEVCMESTGKYWVPVFNVLERADSSVILVCPKCIKPQEGNRTGQKDTKQICDLFMCEMIKPSPIPPAGTRHLRDLVRCRFKLTCMIIGEKSCAQSYPTVSNPKLDDVSSGVFGKSSRSIAEYILTHLGEIFDVVPLVGSRCKTSMEEIQAAVGGAISPEQTVRLRQCFNHIDELEKHLGETEQEIPRFSDKYQAALGLIRIVPGFDKDPVTTIQILSGIGGDMSVFPLAKHLVSRAGCCSRNDQSNERTKSTRISRAGNYIKPILVQVADGLLRSEKPISYTCLRAHETPFR